MDAKIFDNRQLCGVVIDAKYVHWAWYTVVNFLFFVLLVSITWVPTVKRFTLKNYFIWSIHLNCCTWNNEMEKHYCRWPTEISTNMILLPLQQVRKTYDLVNWLTESDWELSFNPLMDEKYRPANELWSTPVDYFVQKWLHIGGGANKTWLSTQIWIIFGRGGLKIIKNYLQHVPPPKLPSCDTIKWHDDNNIHRVMLQWILFSFATI